MCASLVVVAESSRARIFELLNPNVPMQELSDLVHLESRAHEQDLTSDLPGRTHDRYGQGRHVMEDKVGPKEQEAIVFAGRLANYLETECDAKGVDRLYLVASPQFLGHLRKKLADTTKRRVEKEIDKNLVQLNEAEIRKHLFQ